MQKQNANELYLNKKIKNYMLVNVIAILHIEDRCKNPTIWDAM